MAKHTAFMHWQREDPDFLKGKYSREHTWTFDGGATVPASAAPSVVPVPYSNPSGVDPEEAFVAALASCHLLTFLHVASKHGFVVDQYRDEAVGTMAKNERGVPWVNTVTLSPEIKFGGEQVPTAEQVRHLHHLAHEQCFIANSVKTEVLVSDPPHP